MFAPTPGEFEHSSAKRALGGARFRLGVKRDVEGSHLTLPPSPLWDGKPLNWVRRSGDARKQHHRHRPVELTYLVAAAAGKPEGSVRESLTLHWTGGVTKLAR